MKKNITFKRACGPVGDALEKQKKRLAMWQAIKQYIKRKRGFSKTIKAKDKSTKAIRNP